MSGAILGRTQAVGLGKETTPGTSVAPTIWIPQQELTVEDKLAVITDDSALGTRYDAFAVDTDLESADGNLNGIIYDAAFGHLALATMGSVTSSSHSGATGVKDHVFAVANTLPTYTIAKKDGNENVRHAYSVLDQLEISVESGKYAQYTSSWKTRKSASASNTVSYTDQNRFRPGDVSVYYADTVGDLDSADPVKFKSVKLTISNNLITEPVLGTTDPDYYPGVVQTKIEFGKLYVDTTFHDLVFGNTPKALRIAMIRSDVEIGTGTPTNPAIKFDFEPGFFSAWSRSGGLNDLKQETVSYQPIFSTADSKQFTLTVTNTTTSY